jgi:hypothetical protein
MTLSSKYKKTLNDVDRFFIDGNKQMTPTELSKVLNITVGAIRKHRDAQPAQEVVTTTKADKFARRGGAIVMTEAQSMIGDGAKRSSVKDMSSCVHTIRKE